MIIIIKNKKLKINLFNENIVILDNLCDIKRLNSSNNILLLLDLNIQDGVITDYNFYLEEVFVTIPINLVIANFVNEKVREICKYHNISFLEL